MGPLHCVTVWLLKIQAQRSKEPLHPETGMTLLELMHAPKSPVYAVAQFCSSLLMEPWSSGIVDLLPIPEEFFEAAARALIIYALATAGGIYIRFHYKLMDVSSFTEGYT